MNLFDTPGVRRLAEAFLSLSSPEECEAFLEDLLTGKEILDAAQRLEVAQMLRAGAVYSEISRKTGASSATISRVNRACLYGRGGYAAVLERLEEKSDDDTEK